MCLRRNRRVILLHGRRVSISDVGSLVAFNCVSISLLEFMLNRLFNWGRSRWSSQWRKPLLESDMCAAIRMKTESWSLSNLREIEGEIYQLFHIIKFEYPPRYLI